MPEIVSIPKPQPINGQPSGLVPIKKGLKKYRLYRAILAIVIILISSIISIIICCLLQLSPVGGKTTNLKKVIIADGSTLSQISQQLKEASLIHNSIAFDAYVRYLGKKDDLRAGTYRLSPGESTQQIVEHLLKGSVDTFNITFYPGATLIDVTNISKSKKYDVNTVLENAGYDKSEIEAALADVYDTETDKLLFANRPSNADLEGYIYGQTYNFNVGATVHDILQTTFDEFYKQIEANNLVSAFSSHGLNLYEGITLASIIQREANEAQSQKQVAQVFYLRISNGMTLGSDVTYQYIADKTGVPRDTELDSPYNLRLHTGLTPGPISAPGLSALLAVANPAPGDYLYFLAGDDGIMRYATTLAEHEANIVDYCKIRCSTF